MFDSDHRENPWFMASVVSIVATSLYIIVDYWETGEVVLNRVATFALVFFAIFFFIRLSLNYSVKKGKTK